ncbi:hypothetical protein DPMN_037672 [Dreissena polymorpha]|uniref:Uncharacterized protein n=1 Tax=Dreissena polymorpha TaxID=45954 RepID=A0A9D4MD16_DREPO|nr:hypothetical protein DPMN_037672 [Dreissena polymorpha]
MLNVKHQTPKDKHKPEKQIIHTNQLKIDHHPKTNHSLTYFPFYPGITSYHSQAYTLQHPPTARSDPHIPTQQPTCVHNFTKPTALPQPSTNPQGLHWTNIF